MSILLALVLLAQTTTGPAGQYLVTTTAATTITQTATSITLSWGSPNPSPTPPPTPPPVPPPVPVPVIPSGQHVWAIAIWDDGPGAAPLSAGQFAAFSSPTLQSSALSQDMSFQPHPKSDPSMATWLPHVPVTGYPALIFGTLGPDGKKGIINYATTLPINETDILALIGKVRGK